MPDELSRSGVLEETQHAFNAALILRHAIQSLQPITPFPAEPADLSEKKIDVHVPSELYMYNFLSRIMTGKLSSEHSTLSEQESRARQLFFAHVFLDVLFNFLYLHH